MIEKKRIGLKESWSNYVLVITVQKILNIYIEYQWKVVQMVAKYQMIETVGSGRF